MALTPEDIEERTFKVARRGYDKVEVDRFLGQVATDYRQLQQEASEAAPRADLSAASGAPTPLPRRGGPGVDSPTTTPGGQLFAAAATTDDAAAAASLPLASAPAPLPTPPSTPEGAPAPEADDFNRLGSEVADVLRTAHHSVANLRHDAEVEAALIRQRAEREIDELRRAADDYAARTRVEADAYAAEQTGVAETARRDADRLLAEAQARAELTRSDADASLAEARVRAEQIVADAEAAAATIRADADARAAALLRDAERRVAEITGQAQAVARAQAHEILAEADRRLYDADRQLEQAHAAETALRDKLSAAHGDLAAVLEQFTARAPAPVGAEAPAPPTIDLTEGPAGAAPSIAGTPPATIDLTDEPSVPQGWPGAARPTGRPAGLFGDRATTVATADPVAATLGVALPYDESDDAPRADDTRDTLGGADDAADDATEASRTTGPSPEDGGQLGEVVRDAIGRAVQSTMQRDDEA